jgi:hypothetical protein
VQKRFDKCQAVPIFSDLEPEPFRPELPAHRRRELLALADFEAVSKKLTEPTSTDANDTAGRNPEGAKDPSEAERRTRDMGNRAE